LIGKRTVCGQTIVELLVALGLFSVTFTSMVTLVLHSRTLVVDRRQSAFANDYAQEGLEAARFLRDQNWTYITDGQHGLIKNGNDWQFSGTSDSRNGYTRTVTVSTDSANRKTVASRVTWQASAARTPTVRLLTVLTNWKTTTQDNQISGDWTNPSTVGSANIESGAAGTDVIAQGDTVYLSSKHANIAKVDFSTFDISNSATPTDLWSDDMGVTNITAIAKSGNYVYGSIANSADEIMIIDVTNPTSPTKVKAFPIPNSNGVALSIAVNGPTLYVGMQQISGEAELFAINVSNPLSPQVMGSFEVNGDVSSIALFNNRAYLATSGDTAELMVVDITNPTAMTKLGQFDAPGTENGLKVYVKDEYNVYLGRQLSATLPEFNIINAGTPSAITSFGAYDLGAGINDMIVINRLVFLSTDSSNAEFQILDIANPASITVYSSLNLSQVATGIDFENNTIYTSLRSNDSLKIIGPGT
jgi:hypothetical protein